MTLPKLTTLTDEQINVMIAEQITPGLIGPYGCYSAPQLAGFVNGQEWIIADYCSDLDAMHKAETSISGRYLMFESRLKEIVLRDWRESPPEKHYAASFPCHATAKQRATAFLLATGRARA